MDISLEEAAEDLDIPIAELENIEKGNVEYFSNVLQVRQLIEKYGKYLGLDYETLVDDFNEYLFDFTSKLSLNEIKNSEAETAKKSPDTGRLRSPYTMESYNKNYTLIGFGALALFLIGLIIFLFLL